MIITQRSVGVEIADVIPMIDGLPRTPAINPDLGSAALIAANRFVVIHKSEIMKSLDADFNGLGNDFNDSRRLYGRLANREVRAGLDPLDPEDRKSHLATYLRHLSRFEGRDGLTTKRELRTLPFSFDQLPSLIEFYGSRVDIYDTAVASSLNRPYALQEFPGVDAIAQEAIRVVDTVGVTESTGDIFHAALETSPILAEYYKHDPRTEVYSLLKNVKTRAKYMGHVSQLLDLSVSLGVAAEPHQESEEFHGIAA